MEELVKQLEAIIERIDQINTQLKGVTELADMVSREIFLNGKAEGLDIAAQIIERRTNNK